MVVLLVFHHSAQLPLPPSLRNSCRRRSSSVIQRSGCRIWSSMAAAQPGFMEFPHLSTSHKELMVDLVSTMETKLVSQLLPCSLPQDVQYFESESGRAQGTLYIRPGDDQSSSPVDFILGSWIHSELPSGSLNITTLTAYLNTKTDAPRFVLEFIQGSPKSLILILDLPHRKDLILNPAYLDTFYTKPQIDTHRLDLQKLPEIKPYLSSSLYIRSALSPTAISISCETEEEERMEEIVRDHIGLIAKKLLEIWLSNCASGGRELEEVERAELAKRDAFVNKKTLEIDLASGLPRLFGDDVAARVINAIQSVLKT